MNIANIFGLHIGCRVKIPNGKIFKIDQVYRGKGTGRPMITDNEQDVNLYIEHCKLILKPLSAITDEDKAEFMEKFNTNSYYHPIDDRTPIDIWRTVKREIKIKEGFWLASKGYDIGIVPDEYCEVEE